MSASEKFSFRMFFQCYTLCVAEMGGVVSETNWKNVWISERKKNIFQLTKKKEYNEAKIKTQAELLLPTELKEGALATWAACKTVRKCFEKDLSSLWIIFSQKALNNFVCFYFSFQQLNTKIIVIDHIIWPSVATPLIHLTFSSHKF